MVLFRITFFLSIVVTIFFDVFLFFYLFVFLFLQFYSKMIIGVLVHRVDPNQMEKQESSIWRDPKRGDLLLRSLLGQLDRTVLSEALVSFCRALAASPKALGKRAG